MILPLYRMHRGEKVERRLYNFTKIGAYCAYDQTNQKYFRSQTNGKGLLPVARRRTRQFGAEQVFAIFRYALGRVPRSLHREARRRAISRQNGVLLFGRAVRQRENQTHLIPSKGTRGDRKTKKALGENASKAFFRAVFDSLLIFYNKLLNDGAKGID